MSTESEDPGKTAAFDLVTHRQDCPRCQRADRRVDMCGPGKTLYDDMVAAAYMTDGRREAWDDAGRN